MSCSTELSETLTIRVSKDLCCGAQLCAAIAPDIYLLDQLGYNASDGRIVPASSRPLAERGMRACPERAIRLIAENKNSEQHQ